MDFISTPAFYKYILYLLQPFTTKHSAPSKQSNNHSPANDIQYPALRYSVLHAYKIVRDIPFNFFLSNMYTNIYDDGVS